MDSATVSVCVPTRNRARDLAARLGELSAQTWLDLDIVIVDDGSSDDTSAVVALAAADDPRIRYVRLEPTIGMPGVVNAALEHARGELVAVFHDHDEYTREAVEKLARALLGSPDAAFAFCGIVSIDPVTGSSLATLLESPEYGRQGAVLDDFVATGACKVAGCAVMVRRSMLPLPPFPPNLGAFADVGLWCALSAAGPTPYVREALARVQAWTEQDAVGKLTWSVLGQLAALRRTYIPVVRHTRCGRLHARWLVTTQTWRLRISFLARILRLGVRGEPIPDRAGVDAPRPVAAVVDASRLLSRRGRFERGQVSH